MNESQSEFGSFVFLNEQTFEELQHRTSDGNQLLTTESDQVTRNPDQSIAGRCTSVSTFIVVATQYDQY